MDKLPTIHLGPNNSKLERAGIPTAPGEYNRLLTDFHRTKKKSPTENELKNIQNQASIARYVGRGKSEVEKAARRDANRKRAISQLTGNINSIIRRARTRNNETDRAAQQFNRMVAETVEAIARILAAKLQKRHPKIDPTQNSIQKFQSPNRRRFKL